MDEHIYGTAEDNLKIALQQEEIIRSMMPDDPYFRIGKDNIDYYLGCAAALERGETTFTRHKDRFK